MYGNALNLYSHAVDLSCILNYPHSASDGLEVWVVELNEKDVVSSYIGLLNSSFVPWPYSLFRVKQ